MQTYGVRPTGSAKSHMGLVMVSLGILTPIFSVVTMMVILVERVAYPDGYSNPLAEVAGLEPGQPIALLEAYPCVRMDSPYRDPRYSTCSFSPPSGYFKRVVVGSYADHITGVTLTTENVRVYDLIDRWGQPDHIRRDPAAYVLLWDEGVMGFTVTSQRRFSPHLLVKTVTRRLPTEQEPPN